MHITLIGTSRRKANITPKAHHAERHKKGPAKAGRF